MIKIKICGMTNLEDALFAANAGVDAVGFIFAPSPRQVTPETVRAISLALPPSVMRVGVFVNEAPERVNALARECNLDAVQLHGDEAPEDCRKIEAQVIKAIRIKNNGSIPDLSAYEPIVSAFLFDTYSPNQRGGTGIPFDWTVLKTLSTTAHVMISGGLNADTLPLLLKTFTPYAVDLSSGVESAPGKKDHEKILEIVKLIRKLF